MIETKQFLAGLDEIMQIQERKASNDDLDFGEVLFHCFGPKAQNAELLNSDDHAEEIHCV